MYALTYWYFDLGSIWSIQVSNVPKIFYLNKKYIYINLFYLYLNKIGVCVWRSNLDVDKELDVDKYVLIKTMCKED